MHGAGSVIGCPSATLPAVSDAACIIPKQWAPLPFAGRHPPPCTPSPRARRCRTGKKVRERRRTGNPFPRCPQLSAKHELREYDDRPQMVAGQRAEDGVHTLHVCTEYVYLPCAGKNLPSIFQKTRFDRSNRIVLLRMCGLFSLPRDDRA